jgi:hypothetical protein
VNNDKMKDVEISRGCFMHEKDFKFMEFQSGNLKE